MKQLLLDKVAETSQNPTGNKNLSLDQMPGDEALEFLKNDLLAYDSKLKKNFNRDDIFYLFLHYLHSEGFFSRFIVKKKVKLIFLNYNIPLNFRLISHSCFSATIKISPTLKIKLR